MKEADGGKTLEVFFERQIGEGRLRHLCLGGGQGDRGSRENPHAGGDARFPQLNGERGLGGHEVRRAAFSRPRPARDGRRNEMAARDGDILQNHSRPRPCATPTTRSRKRALGCGKAEDRESRTSHFYPPDLTFARPIPILSLLRRGLRLRGWKQSWSAGMRLIFMLARARLMWISLCARPTQNVGSRFSSSGFR